MSLLRYTAKLFFGKVSSGDLWGICMALRVNEREYLFRPGMTVGDLREEIKREADLFIVNGFAVSPSYQLADGDICWLVCRTRPLSPEEMEHLLYARHTPGVQERLKFGCVGVMGLGGLGSAVAVALVRMGVGKLRLADYDVVDPTNLNRQQYFFDQVGMRKTEAMRINLNRMNPYVAVELIEERLTEENICTFFTGVDVLVECFDDPVMKASGMRAAMTCLKGVKYVGASGVAGYGDSNLIRTERVSPAVYVVGDHVSAAAPGQGLMAARVGIAAHHQANLAVRILLGEEGMDEGDADNLQR